MPQQSVFNKSEVSIISSGSYGTVKKLHIPIKDLIDFRINCFV